eukprot:scaffold505412_cov21-Prasinocladus_malaysianus.AAC.1
MSIRTSAVSLNQLVSMRQINMWLQEAPMFATLQRHAGMKPNAVHMLRIPSYICNARFHLYWLANCLPGAGGGGSSAALGGGGTNSLRSASKVILMAAAPNQASTTSESRNDRKAKESKAKQSM